MYIRQHKEALKKLKVGHKSLVAALVESGKVANPFWLLQLCAQQRLNESFCEERNEAL